MKILQVDVSVNRGSTGRIAEEIGQQALSCGWKSSIAYGRYANPSSSDTIKIGTLADQAYHLLMTRLFDNHGIHSVIATKQLVKQIISFNPDIIQLHQLHGYYINLQVLFSFLKEFNKPVVWTFHDCWQMTGHCCYFTKVECEKWKTQCHDCPLSRSYPASWFSDKSEENYLLKKRLFSSLENLTIVSVSSWLDGIISESYLKDRKRVVITNGIDTDLFKPCEAVELRIRYGINDSKIILGVADYWSPHKGYKDFIELSGIISEDYKILLIGLDKEKQKNLPENIIGLPRTENVKQLAQFYSLADVFVNPSGSESFGLVTVEALSCGTPVVVYNSTASPELIKPGTGLIVRKGDIHELNVSIGKIISSGKSAYLDKCRDTALKYYNKDIQYSQYIDLYKSLIKNNL